MKSRRIAIVGWTLIWGGLFTFGYLGWQLLGTDVLNARVQAEAAVTLDRHLEVAAEEPVVVEVVEVVEEEAEGEEPSRVEHFQETPPVEGEGFARISVPSVGLEAVVFEGVSSSTLAKGPGHMPGTPLPGQPGNSVISGHRTTYGRPFYDFDLLVAGDRIEVETSIGLHVYEVRESFVVVPTDVWVTDDKAGAWLTLTTCHPRFSARERLIVTAELVEGPNLEYVQFLDRLPSPA
ncbi:MAG TPA: sortase [Acidimicrobiia bacterium]|nr:sortase [Acidimicrobiia bacterium]